MRPDRYFAEERRAAALFVAAGLAAITLALALAARPTPYRGMIPPLVLLGLVEMVVGATAFLRSPRMVETLHEPQAAENRLRARERERMRRVLRSFRMYKAVEIVVLTAGLTLLMLFPRHTPLYAAGLGCLLQASVLLMLDRFAERRAQEYAAALQATCWRRPGSDLA